MPGKVFISYSREDADWLALATEHLGAIELEVWDDTRIGPGEDWLPAIERAMAECQFALLLVSASYLSSPFIKRTEIPALLQRRAAEGLTVIPVLVRPCAWSKVDWLARINMRPKGDKALSRLGKPKAEAELAALAGEIAGRLATAAAARQREAPHVDLHHLPEGAADFFGRGADLEWLDAQWQTAGAVSVAVLVAPGGTGKTSLLRRWLQRLKANGWGGAQRVFAYSFYRQGVSDAGAGTATDEPFLNAALAFFEVRCEAQASAWDRGRRLAQALMAQRALLVLDGVEPLQDAGSYRLRTDGLKALLTTLADAGRQSLCVLSTRAEIADLQHYGADGAVRRHRLDNLCAADGARLLHRLGVHRIGGQTLSEDEAAQDTTYHCACQSFGGHALTLHILGLYLASRLQGDLRRLDRAALLKADAACKPHPHHAFHVMHAYECWLEQGGEHGARQLAVLRLLGLFDRPATPDCLRALLRAPVIDGLTEA
ncbi:MAG TPA: toll/interleukin-1 receptor domain-containing protein, partial [Plasticicumulans sp.]|nr:toll/interleukin-1 receptor domain-containing protein [Plasticicumulans sp.]